MKTSNNVSLSDIAARKAAISAELSALNAKETKAIETVRSFPKQLAQALGRPVSIADCAAYLQEIATNATVGALNAASNAVGAGDMIKRNAAKGKRLSDTQRDIIRHMWAERQDRLSKGEPVQTLSQFAKRLKVSMATIYHYAPDQLKAA